MIRYILNKEKCAELIKEAAHFSFLTKLSELDCSKSWSRIDTNMSFDQILKIAKKSKHTHYFFLRKHEFITKKPYLSIGLRTENKKGLSLFIFLDVSTDKHDYLVKKYDIRAEEY